jgi:hypothetical protein
VSFADYGRAILAVDEGGNLNPPQVREWLRDELLNRGVVEDLAELAVEVNQDWEGLRGIDLDRLVADDSAARELAEAHRDFLRIPRDVTLEVRPRQVIEKTYYDVERAEIPARECLLKVTWEEPEANELFPWLPAPRAVRRGSTLVIDLLSGRVRALLTSDRGDRHRRARERMFRRLYEQGLVRFDDQALGPDGRPLESAVQVLSGGELLRVRGTCRLLHIVE